jgi:hypothetical protein
MLAGINDGSHRFIDVAAMALEISRLWAHHSAMNVNAAVAPLHNEIRALCAVLNATSVRTEYIVGKQLTTETRPSACCPGEVLHLLV